LQDHLQEVIEKWDSIDDEIWAKVIVLERNRRVAKGQLISKDISFTVNSSKNDHKNLPKIDPEVSRVPSSIYSCSIGHIVEHEFCHLGWWVVLGKISETTEILLNYATFLGGFLMFSCPKN
jgi:hypothetical protein